MRFTPSRVGTTVHSISSTTTSSVHPHARGDNLIGPSVTTGYDFPGTQCEYQILAKVPFPDSRSPILKARCEQDKLYADYLTMQTLVQTCGRAMRSKMDQCENFIVDDNIRWFMSRNGNTLAPKWFRRTYRILSKVPPPLPKLK